MKGNSFLFAHGLPNRLGNVLRAGFKDFIDINSEKVLTIPELMSE